MLTYVAKEVLKSSTIARQTVEYFCKNEQRNSGEIVLILRNRRFDVSENPVFKLTRQQRQMLEIQIHKGYPYGNVEFTSRLMAYSQTKVT